VARVRGTAEKRVGTHYQGQGEVAAAAMRLATPRTANVQTAVAKLQRGSGAKSEGHSSQCRERKRTAADSTNGQAATLTVAQTDKDASATRLRNIVNASATHPAGRNVLNPRMRSRWPLKRLEMRPITSETLILHTRQEHKRRRRGLLISAGCRESQPTQGGSRRRQHRESAELPAAEI